MFSRIQAIWREGCLDMTIRGDSFVWSVAGFPAFELGDVLGNQVAFDAVASDEGQTFLKDFQFSQGRKFVNHSQEPVLVGGFWAPVFKLDSVGQKPDNHVHDN